MTNNHSPATVAQQQLEKLLEADELTTDQRPQLGLLAAQIETAQRLKSIENHLDAWTEEGLTVRDLTEQRVKEMGLQVRRFFGGSKSSGTKSEQ